MRNYRAAVDFLLDEFDHLGKQIFSPFGDQIATLPMLVSEMYGVKHVTLEDGITMHDCETEDGFVLAVLSENDHEIFDFLIWLCKFNVVAGCRVPRGLELFASEVLSGERKRPTPRHREAKVDVSEAAFLFRYVKLVSSIYGLPITRNDVSPSLSACDAVAEAMSEFGRPTSDTKIKDLMTHPSRKVLRERIEIINRFFEAKVAEKKSKSTT